ncbi:hypothetical protein AWZ03_011063 [Drosophila navojoa]|uniref:Uncharacterized protein n=1 Tax=Drosophila navojoa TaxID=7232 RepID=A0A484B1F2_DRONA|nr:uncharacterized protein LOC108656001 [Drosophila navojoa]TDG42514.1 hypothetical protein AWZ03_011063 [Drosophila navojoa]
MADGFKKYFNGSTMSGRANVAKATYATLALVYLFYRVRRGKSQPAEGKEPPNCSCDQKKKKQAKDASGRDCSVCRERKPREDRCSKEPPPPPPPSASGKCEAPKRRKCPCDAAKPQHTQHHPHSNTKAQPQHNQPAAASFAASPENMDEAHPARELITQMHEAASRVLRNVIGAVIGDTASGGTCCIDTDEKCNRVTKSLPTPAAAAVAPPAVSSPPVAVIDPVDQLDDEGSDYDPDNQLLIRQRRTAPRSCVPNNTSSEPDTAAQLEELAAVAQPQTESQTVSQLQTPTKVQSTTTTQSQPESQPQRRFRYFENDFASEMFFEDFED